MENTPAPEFTIGLISLDAQEIDEEKSFVCN